MKSTRSVLVTALIQLAAGPGLHAAEFVILAGSAAVDAVSDDGTVVAGGHRPASSEAWSWTRNDGFSLLTPLLRGDKLQIRGLSGDATVTGGSSGPRFEGIATAWTADEAPVPLGVLPGGDSSLTNAVSADGKVLVGSSSGIGFRWSALNDMEPLHPLPGGNYSSAYGVSANGSVVVGQSSVESQSEIEATIWIQENGENRTVGLGKPDGRDTWASLVSRDGSTVVGGIGGIGIGTARWRTNEPFRWTESTGMVPLGLLNGAASTPTGISHDASVIVGNSWVNSQSFIWDETHGMRDLQAVLRDEHGTDALSGWFRVNINTMSANARTLGGRVWECENCAFQAWALFLDRPLNWIPGDVDHDFDVDFADFLTLSANFGLSGDWEDGDFDLNGTVEFADFLALSGNFNIQPIATAAVPEPIGVSLVSFFLIVLVIGSQRNCRNKRNTALC